MLHDAVVERPAGGASAQGREAAARQGAPREAQGDVGGVDDGAARAGEPPGQVVAVGQAEFVHPGELECVLGLHHVAGPPGPTVQLGAQVEHECAGRAHVHGRAVDELGGGQGVEELHVAQAAVTILQVGLHAVGDLPRARPPRARGLDQLIEATAHAGAPRLSGRGGEPLGELGVPGEQADLEKPQRDPQVGGGDADGLADGAHRVVEPDPRVPQRVPHGVGDAGDLLGAPGPARPAPALVDEQQIEVRERGELAATERAHGHERRPLPDTDGGRPGREPEVMQLREGLAQGGGPEPPGARGRGDQGGPGPHEVLRTPATVAGGPGARALCSG